ncbi:MAG: hypothetical protein AAGF97_05095, partial [Planctomycetota bacterium]
LKPFTHESARCGRADGLCRRDGRNRQRTPAPPNGCARPYNADIGLVGKAKGKYTLYLGGTHRGTRLNFLYKDLVPLEDIVPELTAAFSCFKAEREGQESFGDFCHRVGKDHLLARTELIRA